jgi:hypothetical protein
MMVSGWTRLSNWAREDHVDQDHGQEQGDAHVAEGLAHDLAHSGVVLCPVGGTALSAFS